MTADAGALPAEKPWDRALEGAAFAPLAWGCVAAGICAAMAPLEPSLLEEGMILHFAERMVAGERLFTDLASFTGSFPFDLLALLFRVFGEHVIVARGAVVVSCGISTAAVVALSRRSGGGLSSTHLIGAVLACCPILLFPFHSIYFYSTVAYHLALITAYAALRGLESSRWAVAAGALISCAALSKQSVGLALALLVVPAAVLSAPGGRRLRVGLGMAAGGAAVAVSTIVRHAAAGELPAVWRSLVVLPLGFDQAFDSPFPNLWPPGELTPDLVLQAHFYTPYVYSVLRTNLLDAPSWLMTLTIQLLYVLPFVSTVATLAAGVAGRLPAGLWIHGAVMLALASNLFPRTDWGHLVFVVAPAIVQLGLLGSRVRPARLPRRELVAAVIALFLLGSSVEIGRRLWLKSAVPNLGPRVGLRPVSDRMHDPALARVIAHVERHVGPDEPIFVPRSEPLLYFATGRRNPTAYGGVVPGFFEEQESAILEALEDVRWVLMSEVDQPTFTYYREMLPGVAAYLERYFQVAEPFEGDGYGWIVVLERKGDRGVAAIDFFDLLESGTPWMRNEQGQVLPHGYLMPRLATSHNRRPLPIALDLMGGGIDFEIDVPDGAVFQADIGLERVFGIPLAHPRNVDFEVAVAHAGVLEPISSVRPFASDAQGGRWRPFEVDLSRFAGERITLRLSITPSESLRDIRLAWLGSPRIIVRTGP